VHTRQRRSASTRTSPSSITKKNWEGTGVAPDIAVPADQALETAKQLAARP
jgi:hypothetical protein